MIPKPLHEIGLGDLQALLDDEVPEGKTIEYKREMPANSDAEKAKFLAAVSSFANTSGGDLLLGVEESGGLPTELRGIDFADVDKEKLRLEQVVATGLEPRLPRLEVQQVPVAGDRHVIVVRVHRSWVSPHWVRQNHKFYGRNSAGRYELDVGELRIAFTLSETVAERIRSFRTERIANTYGDETPVQLKDGGRMILHLVPLSAFTGNGSVDIEKHHEDLHNFIPIGAGGWNNRINLDGYLNYTGGPEPSRAYTLLFRTGVVEAVATLSPRNGHKGIASIAYEKQIIEATARYSRLLQGMEVETPIYAFLSFVGVKGYGLGVSHHRVLRDGDYVLDRDALVLPEVTIDTYEVDFARVMRPAFDLVWNAFGFLRSFNYDEEGNWAPGK